MHTLHCIVQKSTTTFKNHHHLKKVLLEARIAMGTMQTRSFIIGGQPLRQDIVLVNKLVAFS